jgi:hypothetical protein
MEEIIMAKLILGLALPFIGFYIICQYDNYRTDRKITKTHKYIILKLKDFVSFYNLDPEIYNLQEHSVVFLKPLYT